MLKNPSSTKHLWVYLQYLEDLPWPTVAEQVERRMLVEWLNPNNTRNITDQRVLQLANLINDISITADEQTMAPAFADAEVAWVALTKLANGEKLTIARTNDGSAQAALDWWRSVMLVADKLVATLLMSPQAFTENLPAEVTEVIRCRTAIEILDAPMNIGAHAYMGATNTGWNLWAKDNQEYMLVALINATLAAIKKLRETSEYNPTGFREASASLAIFWDMLHGYLWASVQKGGWVPRYFSKNPSMWGYAQWALKEGYNCLTGISRKANAALLGDVRTDMGVKILHTTVEDVIHSIEKEIATLPIN